MQTSPLPLQERPLIGDSTSTTTLSAQQLDQSEQQKAVDAMEPTLRMPSVPIESDPILQNSLQSVERFIASDTIWGSSASGKVVELNEIRPTRESSVPQWQMSDSSDDDLGIEAEVVTCTNSVQYISRAPTP